MWKRTQSHVRVHKSIIKCITPECFFFYWSVILAPKLLFPWVCFAHCVLDLCRETGYMTRFEWGGNQLCTTDSAGHAVSKIGLFCEHHKLSQTHSQGHTSTETLCMWLWDNLCKWRKSMSLWIWWMGVFCLSRCLFFLPPLFEMCITAINHPCLESSPQVKNSHSNSTEWCICKSIRAKCCSVMTLLSGRAARWHTHL